jgi:hypothetical protein
MASADALHRYYYGEMKLPRTKKGNRYGWSRDRELCIWFLHFSFNWWSVYIVFWHRYMGGFSVAYQSPKWIHGWAQYGLLNQLEIYLPKPSLKSDEPVLRLFGFTRWSNVVTDRELQNLVRS